MTVMSLSEDVYDSHSSKAMLTTFVFVFNLIVGAGALAIPKPFSDAGFVLGAPFLAILCMFSFITAMYMVEVILTVRIILEHRLKGNVVAELGAIGDTREPLLEKTRKVDEKKVEMGALSKTLFTPLGSKMTYFVLCSYLLGDLAIYGVTIPKSLTALVCPHKEKSLGLGSLETSWTCENFRNLPKGNPLHGMDSFTIYRSFVVLLGLVQLPFMFQGVQKTLVVQILSVTYRWSAFFIIIIICIVAMLTDEDERNWDGFFKRHNFKGLLPLFGVSTYSFMCHHSLPSLLDPIISSVPNHMLDIKRISKPVSWALSCVLLFYLLMNAVVSLRWPYYQVEDVITLNFQNFHAKAVAIFLELFPVCTLGASFPIIACTLRNNLQSLIDVQSSANKAYGLVALEKVILPIMVLLIPLSIAFFTENVEALVSITGSYGGCMIEFVIPAFLMIAARKKANQLQNKVQLSKVQLGLLSSPYVTGLVLGWSALCLTLVTMHELS